MKLCYQVIVLSSLITLFSDCSEKEKFETRPCQFAPADSNWGPGGCTDCNWACVDCFFNIQFRGQEYKFNAGNINRAHFPCGQDDCRYTEEYRGGNLSFVQSFPSDTASARALVGMKLPFVKNPAISSEPSSLLTIFNMCNEQFHVIDNQSITDSYNLITSVRVAESFTYLNNDVPFISSQVNYTGEIHTYYRIGEQDELVTGTYELRFLVDQPQ